MFFSFDGIDGVGKTTQMQLFCDWLQTSGHDVVSCRDPGGTPLGDAIRELLLHRHDLAISRMAEMLLYMAARAQLVEEVIRPALAAGKTVVSDRYLLANVVYQGHAGGLDVATIWQIGTQITGGVEPALTFVLDMPPAAAAGRIQRPTWTEWSSKATIIATASAPVSSPKPPAVPKRSSSSTPVDPSTKSKPKSGRPPSAILKQST